MKYVGVMTGTSMDGLDVALIETGTHAPAIIASETVPLPAKLAQSLADLTAPGDDEVARLGVADAVLGDFVGRTVLACLRQWSVPTVEVRAIGSHGQTIRHRPDAAKPFTMQIGDPNRIAEVTGIDTVADFRRRDMAAGGQGAPLAPLFHDALFRDPAQHRVVVNIGGIANATMLAAGAATITGFDTGPGNALLDAWARQCLDEPFDRNGTWAASGCIAQDLLMVLQRDAFIHAEPPKSTGKETYHLDYIESACRAAPPHPPADVQATLAEFTAWSIALAVDRWGPGNGDVLVCGGGRHNAHLMARLANRLTDHRVTTTDAVGVDGDALEAAAFAWFAQRTLAGEPGNAPTVTGADGPRILGALYQA